MKTIADEITRKIRSMSAQDRIILAIDGRSASGKTTLAELLSKELSATVFHMDDFFLRPEQRTEQRLSIAGGNVDYERFYDEVLRPLRKNAKLITYRPFDCASMSLEAEISVIPNEIVIVEGAYSCHPFLREYYDLKVFLTVSPEVQIARITERNGAEKVKVFRDKWIPMEEKYFAECRVKENCDLSFHS